MEDSGVGRAYMEEKKSLVGRLERNMSLRIGLHRLKYEDNIKMTRNWNGIY
jgi:hypothetical protein